MIEFDACMATADRIPSTVLPPHAPPSSFYHHTHHHGHLAQVVEPTGAVPLSPHPRLNSLLTTKAEIVTPHHHSATPHPVHHGPSAHHPPPHHPSHNMVNGHGHNGLATPKKVDRPGHHHHQSVNGKKHSQIVSKLQQSISSRLKQTGSQDSAVASAPTSAPRPRTHSLPPQSTPNGALSALVSPPPAAVVATKSNVLKISTSNQSKTHAPPAAISPNSAAEEAKRKKKSHLSRDELARVCQGGDVTFEAYNGSSYMIAVRSMGDRKSLIGYRCDWNACGYMNARVERMFGHIRSQHPEAPTVKKLVTTTGATMTTSTVTTTTSSGSEESTGASTTTTSSSTSARLSLRSSSSLSTASSASSCSLSPRPHKGGSSKSGNSSSNSTLLSALNGETQPLVKAKKSQCKPLASKSAPEAANTHHEHLESIGGAAPNGTGPVVTDASPAVDALMVQPEAVDPVSQCGGEKKLMDLLKQGNDASAHIKKEEDEVSHPSQIAHDMIDIGLGDIKVELKSPIDEMIAEANLDGDKLAALDPAELAETTEQIMQELKTISSNCEQQQTNAEMPSSVNSAANSFPSPVDRNNNHPMGGSESLAGPSTSVQSRMDSDAGPPNKVVDPLDLFDADIEQLLLNDSHPNGKPPGYPQDSFSIDGTKYTPTAAEQQLVAQLEQEVQHSPTFQCQSQQLTPPQATLNDQSQAGSARYEDFSHLNEFAFDPLNANSSMNEEDKLRHSQSVDSEQMMFDGETGEFEGEPGMHDADDCDGSNGSGSSSSGKSRSGKKTGSSKNYIGKQNLFQEFQSEDVAKVRDSENQYIIALQKNMKIVGYRCDWPECEFLTCRKYVMVNHINGKHTNQRPYSCPLCNFNFVKRYFLKAHMHKVHKRRISIDGKDDDDDTPPPPGSKRDLEMMDSFDDNQFEGIPDTPETPSTGPSGAVPASNKKKKGEPPAYPSGAYYPNGGVPDAPFAQQYGNCPVEYSSSGDIPATVPQYSNYNSNGAYSSDPMISGRGQMNGNVYYGDDSYGSDVSASGAAQCNGAFKSGSAAQQSAVFMTPSPSSSVASPLPFTATGAGTPNQKCGGFPTTMYDSGSSFDGSMPYGNGPSSNYSQQTQQQPFLTRSYSQSSQSSVYGSGGVSAKATANGMVGQVDLLTPPLSNSGSNGSCCRSGSTSSGSSAGPLMGATNGNFQQQDSFSSFASDSTSLAPSYPSNGFDDFLSPPSSISSSNSNFSGSYMNNMCAEQQSSNGSGGTPNGSAQRQASAGGCPPLTNTPASASMANASSFYLHTPSPSPSSLSHSPASAPVYNNSAASYNQPSQQAQYQTNFSNAFPPSDPNMSNQPPQSYSQPKSFPPANGTFAPQQSMRPVHSQTYSNGQSQIYGNSYETNGYYDSEPTYPTANGRTVAKAAPASVPNGNFYGNFAPMNATNGLFDSYADSYPVGATASKQMYSGPSHTVTSAQGQTFLSNGAQCWNSW